MRSFVGVVLANVNFAVLNQSPPPQRLTKKLLIQTYIHTFIHEITTNEKDRQTNNRF
jgi:hypothetical protein